MNALMLNNDFLTPQPPPSPGNAALFLESPRKELVPVGSNYAHALLI